MPDLLIVDDNPAIAAALGVRMKAAGITVRCAEGGEQALALVKAQPPDVMLLDIRMPGMSGIEVCQQLKADPSTASVPVVFLSAETSEQTREAALQAGGSRFLNKPYEAIQLIEAIQAVLSENETVEEAR